MILFQIVKIDVTIGPIFIDKWYFQNGKRAKKLILLYKN